MLSSEGFRQWCGRLSLSQEAREAVERVRTAGPTRRVGGGRENVSGRYPSRKMGVTIQFESHRVELAFVYEMEHDPELEKLAQKSPNRYCRDEDGRWRCPPGEAHATRFGLYYRLRSSAEIDWTLQRNIQYLDDYWRFEAVGVASEI